MGRAIVDQPLDDQLTVVWQMSLTEFYTRDTRMDRVSGVALLTSPEHGVLTLGAKPPDLHSDVVLRESVPVRVAGTAHPGQLMVIDESGMVHRVSPGREPVPVWQSVYHPDDTSVVGLPGGRLLVYDDIYAIEMINEAKGKIKWRAPVALLPVMPVGNQLIGAAGATSNELVSLDLRTGKQRWRHDDLPRGGSDILAVIGDVLWVSDSINKQVLGYSVDSGRPMATVALPRTGWRTSLLDQAGRLHIGDENGWLVVDLRQARVAADVQFRLSGMGTVYAKKTLRSADGRLVIADDKNQVFVVHPGQPQQPKLVATCPELRSVGIATGKLIVLSWDGTLTAFGTPEPPQ
jgi:outer membrane protein assembly factor BamB